MKKAEPKSEEVKEVKKVVNIFGGADDKSKENLSQRIKWEK